MARKRRLLRFVGFGCASIVLIVIGIAAWLAIQVREMNAPVALTDYHPFRSQAKKEQYLAFYDARAARWPVPSETRLVDTTWGATFVRISGPADGPPLVLLPGASATSLMFAPNVAAWAERFRVHAVDNVHDFGRSIYVRDLKSADDYVDWLDQVLDGLGTRPNGSACSAYPTEGGSPASTGSRHPERLSRLVLVAPAATVAQFSPEFIKRGLLCVIPHPYFIKSMVTWSIEGADQGNARAAPPGAGGGGERLARAALLPASERGPPDRPVRRAVAELPGAGAVPGRRERGDLRRLSSEAVARLEHVAPEIETEVFPDCGHDISILQRERFNRRVARFLSPDDELKPAE